MRLLKLSTLLALVWLQLHATDYYTIRSGNWHNNTTGQTPWASTSCAGAVEVLTTPGNGDRVHLCNVFNVHCETGTTCTIGDSPANDTSTPALQSDTTTGTGIITLDTGSTFIFKGSIRQSNAIWPAASGVHIQVDSSAGAGTPKYTWRVGQSSLTTAQVQFNGLSGARITFDKASGSGDFGGFTQSFTNAGQVLATYTDFKNCNTFGSGNCISASLDATSGVPLVSLDHSSIDSNSGGVAISAVVGNAVVSLTHNDLSGRDSSGRAVTFGSGTIATLTTGTRQMIDNIALNGTLYIGMDGVIQDNWGHMSSSTLTNIASRSGGTEPLITAGNWTNNGFWLDTGVVNNQASHLPGGTLQRTIFLQSSSVTCGSSQNYHWSYMASVDSLIDGWIYDTDCGGPQQNAIQNIPTTVSVNHEVKNSIILSGLNTTFGIGTGLYDIPSTCNGTTLICPSVSIHHNTLAFGDVGGAECGMGGFESGTPKAGSYVRAGDNIFYRLTTGNACFVGPNVSVVMPPGAVIGADYNWQDSNITGGNKYKTLGTGMYVTPSTPGQHDSSGNPQFFDSSRDFLKWCKSLNPADTSWSDCWVHITARTAGYTPAAAIDYIRAGFVPANATLATADSTGSYPGAVAPQAPTGIPPVVNYTDLDSGPNTGGEHGNGVYVRIWGKYFGATRGSSTVTFGGPTGLVATYVSWSDTNIIVELGASAATGAVQVTVNGVVSNSDVQFTVRSGNIYFLATTGSDTTGNGSFGNPWQHPRKCTTAMSAGDTCYAMNGVTQTDNSTGNALILLTNLSGTAGNPKAMSVYPGAVAIIASTTTSYGVRGFDNNDYWTWANWTIVPGFTSGNKANAAIAVHGVGWRVVNNYMSCPQGNDPTACAEGSLAMHSKFYGNEVTSAGCGEDTTLTTFHCQWVNTATTITTVGTAVTFSAATSSFQVPDHILVGGVERTTLSCTNTTHCTIDSAFTPDVTASAWQYRDYAPNKQYHSVYYSTDSSDVEIAYNNIHDNMSCRGIQFHSSPLTTETLTTASNTTPIVIASGSNMSLVDGTRVSVSGVATNTNANGNWFFHRINSTSGSLWFDKAMTNPSVPNGAGTGGSLDTGLNQYDLSVHDNIIHGQTCDGMNYATVDPSIGPVIGYNNVIYNVGRGAPGGPGVGGFYDPIGGSSNYACVYNPATTNIGNTGSGNIQWYNNTMYDCGSRIVTSSSGAIGSRTGGPNIVASNNITQLFGSELYIVGTSVNYSGTNNIWYGNGGSPAGFTNSLNVNPLFTNTATGDFSLTSSSPAIGAATPAITSLRDFNSFLRGTSPAIGAYEFQNAFVPPPAFSNLRFGTGKALGTGTSK